jgi:hypothetical protein
MHCILVVVVGWDVWNGGGVIVKKMLSMISLLMCYGFVGPSCPTLRSR